eukprot:m.793255 g.793255  ORF g.793255 m.793255 type:complete len:52 (+) comp59227_c0_seq2:3314-3469(+)
MVNDALKPLCSRCTTVRTDLRCQQLSRISGKDLLEALPVSHGHHHVYLVIE